MIYRKQAPARFMLTNTEGGPPVARAHTLTAALRWVRDGGRAFDTVDWKWVTA